MRVLIDAKYVQEKRPDLVHIKINLKALTVRLESLIGYFLLQMELVINIKWI